MLWGCRGRLDLKPAILLDTHYHVKVGVPREGWVLWGCRGRLALKPAILLDAHYRVKVGVPREGWVLWGGVGKVVEPQGQREGGRGSPAGKNLKQRLSQHQDPHCCHVWLVRMPLMV